MRMMINDDNSRRFITILDVEKLVNSASIPLVLECDTKEMISKFKLSFVSYYLKVCLYEFVNANFVVVVVVLGDMPFLGLSAPFWRSPFVRSIIMM